MNKINYNIIIYLLYYMRVLIFGHKGWIGQQVINLLKSQNKHEFILATSRADDLEKVREEIDIVKPTNIMSFIGRTHGKIGDKEYTTIDYLEEKGKIYDNVRDNLYSPVLLGLLCNEYNIHFTYLGTGCIFEYDKDHPYNIQENGFTEESNPNFFGSGYSVVKGFTDQLMKLINKNILNLRIRMPITDETNSRNFITKITTYKKICSVPNSMSVLTELLPILIDMADNKITGTYNFTNPGLISHNEILEMYKEYVDKDFKWENFTIEEQNQILSAGRSNNYLDTQKLEKLYPDIKNIKDSVRDIMKNYKL
jgi:dTDP-4-dehydrorhamnose reductase